MSQEVEETSKTQSPLLFYVNAKRLDLSSPSTLLTTYFVPKILSPASPSPGTM